MEWIADTTARSILLGAIEKAGGWQNYASLKAIKYVKRAVLYHEDGSVESDFIQRHDYVLHPSVSGRISWKEGDDRMAIVYGSAEAYSSVGGIIDSASTESAARAFLSNYYVLFMPFKLADEGVELSYTGKVTLDSGVQANVIKAQYAPAEHDNHSTSDVWWYYFDGGDDSYLASMVHHPPTYAWIDNNRTTGDSLPLRLNTYRKSYRCDSTGNRIFLRGEFWYSDFDLVY